MIHADFAPGAAARPADDIPLQLARADDRLAAIASALEQHVVLGPARLLDDETVIRARALAGDLARQLADSGHVMIDRVRDLLAANRPVMAHLHALVVEWRVASALAEQRALDPVLPPLWQRRLDPEVVGNDAAMLTTALVTAQTRMGEALRQMRLPLAELPGDLHHLAQQIAAAAGGDPASAHRSPDAPATRLVLLERALAGLGSDTLRALRIDEAGLALFLTALAGAAGCSRETVALAMAEDTPIRLALLLRAAGLPRDHAARQLLAIRPDADPALVAGVADGTAAEQVLGR